MNTARIVVLTVAIGAGGIAAYPASGSDNPAPVAQLPSLRSITDVNAKDNTEHAPARRRAESASIIRYGVQSQMTAQN